MNASAKNNLILDISIFTAFLAVANPRSTGSTIHEWLGLAFAAAIITHLLFHWKWIVKITTEFFKKLFHQTRLDYVIDALFFIMMTGAIFSGIMISRDLLQIFGISINGGGSWRFIHSFTANASILIIGIHLARHWKWILSTFTRYIISPITSTFQKRSDPAQPQTLAVQPVSIEKNK